MHGEPTIPLGFCQCGCGEATRLVTQTSARRDIRAGDYRRYVQGHNGAKSPERYLVDPETGCWVWQRSLCTRTGYAQLTHNRKTQTGHRWYYTQAKGPIPDGLAIDHLCRNKRCVNPDHLEAVTSAENTRRFWQDVRHLLDGGSVSSLDAKRKLKGA